MTYAQVKWASQHDWFYASSESDFTPGEYTVITTSGREFTNFDELYIWAGY